MKDARRTYGQHCGLARALDVVGERWTLLIVRELLLGPRRYGDLLETLEGITTNLLAKRLKEMVAAGLVERQRLPPPASADAYALTEAGAELEPVVMELGRWGGRLLASPRPSDRKNLGWALLSLRRRYAGGVTGVAAFTAGDRSFELVFTRERLTVQERRPDRAAVEVTAKDQDPFFALLFGGGRPGALERKGALTVRGDRALLGQMLASLGGPVPPAPGARRTAR